MDKLNEIKRKYDILEAEVEKITERIKRLPVCKLTEKPEYQEIFLINYRSLTGK